MRTNNLALSSPSAKTTDSRLTIANFHPFLQFHYVKEDNARFPDFHINAYGFRGGEIQKRKQPGTYRIFLLGGSTVLNKFTPYEKNVARVLEKKLQDRYKNKKVEVLNAGSEYYTSEHSIIQYMFNIKDFNPDLLIMWQGANDMAISCTYKNDTFGPYQADYSHKFGPLYNMVSWYFDPQTPVHLISFSYLDHFLKTTLFSDVSLYIKKKGLQPNKPSGKAIDEVYFPSITSYKRNLEEMISLTQADNVPLILGNQPSLYNKKIDKQHHWDLQWFCKSRDGYPSISALIHGMTSFNSVTEQVASERNTPFVDLNSVLPKTNEYFSDDIHFYSPKANEMVAKTLYEYIVTHEIIEKD